MVITETRRAARDSDGGNRDVLKQRQGMKNEDRGKEMGKATVKRQENDMSEWPNGPFISK